MNRPINRMRAVHPGEILREDFLVPLGMSVNALANSLNVPATRIHEILKERRSVTADTAQRLARYFGGDAASWLNLQAIYDLKTIPTRHEMRDLSFRRGLFRGEIFDLIRTIAKIFRKSPRNDKTGLK